MLGEEQTVLPLIEAAEEALYSQGDPERCRQLCADALGRVTDDDEFIDLILMKARAELVLDQDDAARATLSELQGCSIRSPEGLCDAAELQWELGEEGAAETAFRDAIALDANVADAHHGLGTVLESRGDATGAIAAWLRCSELDRQAPAPEWHLSDDEFERIAAAAFAELPKQARGHLENVPMLVEAAPSTDMVKQGCDPRVLGLFIGVPRSEEAGQQTDIDRILLFQGNLEQACGSRDELREQIRITVLHETAHFFGLEDDDLDELGLG